MDLPSSQRERMIEILTYHNKAPDREMIICPLYHNRVPQIADKGSHPSIGTFDLLPFEIVQQLVQDLDLESVLTFRQVNSRSKAIVESLLSYQRLKAYVPNAFPVLLLTGLQRFFSLRQLFGALRTEKCDGCGEFGPFLFWPTCSRRCYTCLSHDDSLRVISASAAKACYGLSTKDLRKLPTLQVLAEKRGDGEDANLGRGRRRNLVSEEQVVALGIAKYGTRANMKDFVNGLFQEKMTAYNQRKLKWDNGGATRGRRPQKPRSLTNDFDSRGMRSYPFPFLDSRDKSVHHGISCKGCQKNYRTSPRSDAAARRKKDTAFSESGFLKHFKECAEAQLIWMQWCRTSGFISPV